MNPQLQAILDAIQNNADLNGSEKEALVKKIKEADKSQSLVQFKLDRLERDKQTLSVMLDESIEDLQKKSRAVEEKNRELEIESSLERVRTVAMSMNKPDDMLNVCHIISDQLKLLQIQDIRNVQTIVINESKFEYINYQYFTPYDKNSIEQIDYRLHPVELELAQKMLSSPDAFYSKIFRGNDLQVWRDHRRATHQLPDPLLDEVDSAYYYFFSIGSGALGVTAYSQLTDEALIVFKRFRNVFELAYRRYIDIEKAEAQARESQIQLALERVRARTMAMQKSDELSEAVYILFQQFRELGENPDQATIGVINEKKHVIEYWVTMYGNQMNKVFKFSIDEPNVTNKIYNAWKEGKKSLVIDLSGKNLSEFMAYRAGKGGAAINPNERRRIINIAFFSKGLLNVQSNEQRSEESIKLLERFAAVFEQTYTRFLDLQKAEAQARESQIELGLERVRARAMAMQNSGELADLVATVFKELTQLDFTLTSCIIWIHEPTTDTLWIASAEINQPAQPFQIKPFHNDFFRSIVPAWKAKDPKWVFPLTGVKKKNFEKAFFKELPNLPDALRKALETPVQVVFSASFNNFGALEIVGTETLTDEKFNILHRFGKVFDSSYTRFNDLKKAEAQAREAQIEAALERVRSRTMGMQKSDELQSAALLLFQQIQALGAKYFACGFNIWDEDRKAATAWMAREDALQPPFKTSSSEDVFLKIFEAAKKGESLFVEEQGGEKLEVHYRYMASIPIFRDVMEKMSQAGLSVPTFQIIHCAFFSQGYLMFISYEPATESYDIFKRFAKVFEQTYTRFLDLQKAEAQTREAKIEAALEKVRSRTMAMQKSTELGDVATVLFKELNQLVDNLWTCGFVLCEKDRAEDEWWLSTESGFIPAFYLPNVGDVTHYNIYKGWLEGEEYHTEQLEGEALQEHYDWLMNIPIAKKIFDDLAVAGIERPKWQKLHCAYFSKGYLCIITQVPCPDEIIFRRFAQVFDLTYTRFLDLQKAEAQTREALIEGALERVRARALAMQQPEELKDVAQVLRNEMGALGVEELETSSIYIHGDSSENVECWYALQDPKHTEKKMVSDHFLLNLDDTWVGREMENFYHSNEKQTSVVMQGANRREWIEYCYKHSPVFSGFYGATIPDRTYHLYKFSHGYIGAAAPGDISAESWRLLSRAASVFSLAYSRFKDLSQARNDLIKLKEEKKRAEDALTELQATQKQLIQSEKMASLGELTAGIAHEIQNPLNFVNNFSEVSSELVDEMREELANGNQQLANEIANDLKQNLEKINHHGKRADVIVKGMLQHSRSSSGQKEPTDINALTDEYLRLAYHGLRAKDKSFNATMETDFDETIGKINIVPQDIGRVILNLITNAFYAVTEKKTLRQVQDGYEPTVSVSTKKLNDKVEVKVRDNGNGIPQKVLDKIFQPFFTTKPTGQGTGLGLSLSYDIVKAHGGEIRVDTKENEGTEFTIQLPMI